MKRFIFCVAMISFLPMVRANSQSRVTDEYVQHVISEGKQYIVVLLKAGPNKSLSEDSIADEQMMHLKYLFTLKEEGKLPIFGPFYNGGDYMGFCIFNSSSKEEVKNLIEADPHVKSGYMTYEMFSWFGIPGDGLPK